MNQDGSRRTVNVEEMSSKAMLSIDGVGDISYKDSEISMLKSKLEKLKQEKESNQLKIEKFDNASKSLDKLIGSQIPDKSRKGLEFPEFEGYGPKTSKCISEDISNEVKESPDASLVKELVSDDKLEKKTVFPTVAKIEFIRTKQQEKLVRKPVKYAEMYRLKAVNTARPNSTVVNAVRANQFIVHHHSPFTPSPNNKGLLESLKKDGHVGCENIRRSGIYTIFTHISSTRCHIKECQLGNPCDYLVIQRTIMKIPMIGKIVLVMIERSVEQGSRA
ncbi:hypothetical protein Tco_0500587 [Tanacetum coccineum]